ncbi:hypothetical protein [Microbacterium sp. Leaf320]|uniref:hypothetical protein n=1 Tax=Microbacterium sp. Leaf320 TaxID=1736334 RepID=UPI0006F20B11|nr:hypothetical protein [Microbacterium sp. Leaf320]KQQ65383.1 hypothetical protein ASF63_15720 [Microbacterium sp. Leaf320]
MTNTLDSLQTSVLTEVQAHAARRRGRRRTLAGAGSVLTAAAVAGTIALSSALAPTAAFAVDEQSDGDILITITALADSDALQAELLSHGIEAIVDFTGTSNTAPVAPSEAGPPAPSVPLPTPMPEAGAVTSPGVVRSTADGSKVFDADEYATMCGAETGALPRLEVASSGAATVTIPAGTLRSDTPLSISASASSGVSTLNISWPASGGTCLLEMANAPK